MEFIRDRDDLTRGGRFGVVDKNQINIRGSPNERIIPREGTHHENACYFRVIIRLDFDMIACGLDQQVPGYSHLFILFSILHGG
jgi:hypothetical protein